MKALYLVAASAVASALLMFAASPAHAEQSAAAAVPRNNFTSHGHNFSWEGGHRGFRGHGGGFGGVFIVEREVPVIVEREVVREVAVPVVAAPPPPPRKPYAIGASYDSLPAGCMKQIEGGASYYWCGGEWYRQVGDGRSATFRAVARKF